MQLELSFWINPVDFQADTFLEAVALAACVEQNTDVVCVKQVKTWVETGQTATNPPFWVVFAPRR